eukprot:CAMPEP_0181346652 /NCGR_PEP_ID=MMETSP1101-20121128/33444_1 /TAXON_ID=46948 /ORGANISM="Rhodomonas abbreviata, Strain Caron Lab Isolate" /LENGTH=203 /DNA_ID=CAMNT_0023458783 /DNA_START=141 /DNA_END=752 /DNA_ORIENTATION=-
MNTVKLVLHNTTNHVMHNVRIGARKLEPGMDLQPFGDIPQLAPGATHKVNVYIDFSGKTKPAKFDICFEKPRGTEGAMDKASFGLSVPAFAGELVAPVEMGEDAFDASSKALRGMHEHSQPFTAPPGSEATLRERVLLLANLFPVPSIDDKVFKFSGCTLSDDSAVLLLIDLQQNVVRGNSEATLLCRHIVKDVKEALLKAVA